jgi:hypothetical protein
MYKQLLGNDHRFVFVSTSDAAELRELSDRARDATSIVEFESIFLKAKEHAKQFQRIQDYWGNCSRVTAYEILKRIEVHTIDEANLRRQVRWGMQGLFLAKPDDVRDRFY